MKPEMPDWLIFRMALSTWEFSAITKRIGMFQRADIASTHAFHLQHEMKQLNIFVSAYN